MSLPVFMDIPPSGQVLELRSYLKTKGVEINETNVGDDITDILQVIEATDSLWQGGSSGCSDTDLEVIMNSIISLILYLPSDQTHGLVSSLCDKLATAESGDKRGALRLRLLNTMFNGFDEKCSHRYSAYMASIKLAHKLDLLDTVDPKIDQVKSWFSGWDVSTIRVQAMWRALHEAFRDSNQIDKATKVMVELLGTYTSDNASQARDDAQRCIMTSLADPNTYLMDHLLALKPVKFLEGALIHDLLTIFVQEKLSNYMKFYDENKEFVNSLGLSHEQNMHKMKLLTFMQMAVDNKEISFDTIQKELKISPDEIEPFMINVIRTKAVYAKLDQIQRKVIVSSTTHRTFGKQQWLSLRDQLTQWQANLEQCLQSLQTIPQH